jgi:TRAP-type C4-dicarboxylate transport system permease small subunit
MRLIEKAIALVSRWFNNIGMVFLNFLMLVITADVILRITLNRPIRGSNELAEFIMLLVVFTGVAYTQHMKSNVSVSILYDKFPRVARLTIDIFIDMLCLGICGLILWQAFAYHGYLSKLNRTSLILKIPEAPFEIVMIVGLLMLCLVLVFDIIHDIQRAAGK